MHPSPSETITAETSETRPVPRTRSIKPAGPGLLQFTFPFFLLAVAFVSFRLGFSERGPIDEEMMFLMGQRLTQGTPKEFLYLDAPYRLLHFFFWGVAHRLFGWHFHRYFLIMPLLHWLNAWLYWRILRRLVPNYPWLTAGASVLFLVYPADPTGTILGMLGHTQALLLYLLAVWVMLQVADDDYLRPLLLVGMSIASLASALSYEQLIPLILITPMLLLVYRTPRITVHKAKIAAAWWASSAVLILFRIYLLYTPYGLFSFSGGRPSHAIDDLIASFAGWYRLGLLDAWYWVLTWLRRDLALNTPELRVIPLALPLVIFGVVLAYGWIVAYARRQPSQDSIEPDQSRVYLLLTAAGLVIGAFAYLVIPLVYEPPPDTNLFVSRNNAAPALGFALFYASLISLLAHLLFELVGRHVRVAAAFRNLLAWGGFALLIGLSITWQLNRMRYWQADWEFKAQLWREVQEVAPGLKPGSLLVFVVRDRSIIPTALRQPQVITAMLHILYDDITLRGDNVGPSSLVNTEIRFHDDYVTSTYGDSSQDYPYDRVVFIELILLSDQQRVEAKLLDCLPEDIPIEGTLSGIPCGNHARIDSGASPSVYAQELLYEP